MTSEHPFDKKQFAQEDRPDRRDRPDPTTHTAPHATPTVHAAQSAPSASAPAGRGPQRFRGPEGAERAEFTLPGLLLGGAVLVAFSGALALVLTAVSHSVSGLGPSYAEWLARVPGHWSDRAEWVLGDVTEPQFYTSPIAAAGLLLGAALAWWAGRGGRRWAGAPLAYGSGLWPWVLGGASLSLILSNLAYGPLLDQGWQPTFIPFVCVATAVVLVYGRGWTVLLTGAALGALTTTPVAVLLIDNVTGPLGLPSVVSNTAAMSIGTVISFLVCRLLPWMRRPGAPAQELTPQELPAEDPLPHEPPAQDPTPQWATTGEASEGAVPEARHPEPAETLSSAPPVATMPQPTLLSDAVWMVRRVVTDFTETQFYANELASIGVLLGAVVAVVLYPLFPANGTRLLPSILFAQVLTSVIGVLVWRRLYRNGGWAPTYISVVSVAPATVIAYQGTAVSVVLGALAGALLCPVVARPISQRLPSDFHPFIGNTMSMAASTAIIVPLVGLLPGQ
jgi:hypothetical protein